MESWTNYRHLNPHNYPREDFGDFPKHAIFTLSRSERAACLETSLAICANPYRRKDQEQFIGSSRDVLVNSLSATRREAIRAELNSGFGAVLLQGLPGDDPLPDTPTRGGSIPESHKQTFVSEAILLSAASLIDAEPFNFRQEGRGTAPLIDNIVPIKRMQSQKGAGGYRNNFPFHCESAWHRKRPDYLALIGIRGHPDARTLIFSAQSLTPELLTYSKPESFRLRAPDLYIQMEEQGIPIGTSRYTHKPPIINNGSPNPILNINFNGTDCRDAESLQWLAALESHIESNAVEVVLEPGSILIMNNDLVCHTRTGYEPRFDGQDRWFMRAYFKKDLWSPQEDPSDRAQNGWTIEDFNRLIDLEWITPERNLTSEFRKFVESPECIQELTAEQARLASIAFHFTPIPGSRII